MPRLPRLYLLAPVAAALALSGCESMLTANLEARTICVTHDAESFPGAPGGSGTLTQTITYDLGNDLPLVDQKGVTLDLKVQDVTLTLGSSAGVTDLGGIQTMSITALAPAGSSLQDATLVDYTRATAGHPTSVTADGGSGVEVVPYLANGQLQIRIAASGTLPTQPWTAAVKACFAAKADIQYTKL